jgi:cytidine deaminase
MAEEMAESKPSPPRLTAKETRKLRKAAYGGRPRGWRPYSKFAVAAAVLTKDGRAYGGAGNVECANYTLTKHAEETAVIAALVGGAFPRNGRTFLRAVYLATAGKGKSKKNKCAPCGGCRQFMWEFADEETLVLMERPDGGLDIERLVDMLPDPFGPANLKIKDSDSPPE